MTAFVRQVATRLRFGMVAAMADDSFRLVLKKTTSLNPTVRAKEELQLEFSQAMINYRDGTFTFEEREGIDGAKGNDGIFTEEQDEVWDLAACATFKDAFDKRLAEASAAEEEGSLTAERSREIQRQLEQSIDELEPVSLDGLEQAYLPAAWFEGGVDSATLSAWRKRICARFKELLVEEIIDAGEKMSLMRRLMFDYRMEADPNSYAIMNLFVDRIRRAPKCFGMQFMAAIWTQVAPFSQPA